MYKPTHSFGCYLGINTACLVCVWHSARHKVGGDIIEDGNDVSGHGFTHSPMLGTWVNIARPLVFTGFRCRTIFEPL